MAATVRPLPRVRPAQIDARLRQRSAFAAGIVAPVAQAAATGVAAVADDVATLATTVSGINDRLEIVEDEVLP